QYNPVTNEVVKESGKEKPDVVVVNEKLDVVNENPDVVKEKPDFVKENPASVKEKPAVVKEALRYSRKVDKEAVVKNKLSLSKSNVPTKLHKDKVDKEAVADKAPNIILKVMSLKWKTKTNVKDCGIFTMLHMESYMGQTAKTWDCGLVAESKQQCDMLRQLRFKFATKILLHEINVHAQKMIRYAEEFDKIMGFQKMCIVVDALKNREEREKNKHPA
ncbi:hypothetical protein Tco_0817191, partial [Tanacetum coccineum]